ncbi:MAG: VanZ family protein [Dehalococcoidia bacterium]
MRQEQQTHAQQMGSGRRAHSVVLILWLGVILGVSSWPNPQPPITPPSLLRQVLAPTAHFILYGVLGVLASWNLLRWAPGRVHTLVGVFLVGLFGFLWGMLDEWYQGFIPGRESSLGDVAVDTAGALAGGMVALWLWPRLWWGRRPAGQKVSEGAGLPLDQA